MYWTSFIIALCVMFTINMMALWLVDGIAFYLILFTPFLGIPIGLFIGKEWLDKRNDG